MNRRTSLITAAAVGGALLAGSGAIAANIGVLNAAGDDSLGNLTADAVVATPPSTPETQIVDVYIEDTPATEATVAPTTSAATTDNAGQQFAVEAAGMVTVDQTATGLFVSDVQANDGWEWTSERSSAKELNVTFVSGDTTYQFYAALGPDGLISARVDQPIVSVVRAPAPAPAPSSGSNRPSGGDDDENYEIYEDDDHDDDHEDDHDDDHDDEDEGDEDHEGGDDDD